MCAIKGASAFGDFVIGTFVLMIRHRSHANVQYPPCLMKLVIQLARLGSALTSNLDPVNVWHAMIKYLIPSL
jgi:hypothetical protein